MISIFAEYCNEDVPITMKICELSDDAFYLLFKRGLSSIRLYIMLFQS